MDFRFASEHFQQREMMERAISRINTCMPGEIVSFDSGMQTAIVQPGIQQKIIDNGEIIYRNLPQIINVPVVFPTAGGFALTFPVKPGDPCLLVFGQRAIDNWLDHGGVQPPEQDIPGARHHDLTDAFAIIGVLPNPDALGAWNTAGAELRNRARNNRVTVENDKIEIVSGPTSITVNLDGTVSILAPTSMSIITPLLTVTGDLAVTGYVQDGVRKMSEDRAIYDSHTHTDPQGGAVAPPSQPE
jgi:hypothetical protein